jgi:hypothetical protein
MSKDKENQGVPIAANPDMAKSLSDIEREIKLLELESKKLEVEEKKANIVDLNERLQERQVQRENKLQRSITNGQTLIQLRNIKKQVQNRCNHRKGGNGAEGVIGGQGDDNQYAVLKHKFANSDTWVRCLRCGKTWKPPVRTPKYGPPLTEEEYIKQYTEYQTALQFPTRNVPSGGITFGFSDQGEYYREITQYVNLE